MPCYEVAIEARKNDTAEKCMFSAWIRGENTPKAVEEALQKVAYEHPDFGMLRPVCVEEQKLVAAYWQGTSAPRRQWKIVHKYKVEYRSPVSNRELLKKSYVWAVSAEEAVGYAKENVGISGLTISDYYNEIAERMNLNHLDLICEALDCSPTEILVREPNPEPRVRNRTGFEKPVTGQRKDGE